MQMDDDVITDLVKQNAQLLKLVEALVAALRDATLKLEKKKRK